MQQTEQSVAKTSELHPKQEQKDARQQKTESGQQMLLALRAVQAGVPLTSLPAAMVVALSAQLGNSALLDLMAQQGKQIETVTALPPPDAVRTAPKDIAAAPAAATDPPDWAAMPAVQAAPASPAGLAAQGGAPYAGG
mgnify:CR=1 FL=1